MFRSNLHKVVTKCFFCTLTKRTSSIATSRALCNYTRNNNFYQTPQTHQGLFPVQRNQKLNYSTTLAPASASNTLSTSASDGNGNDGDVTNHTFSDYEKESNKEDDSEYSELLLTPEEDALVKIDYDLAEDGTRTGVCIVSFNDPTKLNPLTVTMGKVFQRKMRQIRKDNDIGKFICLYLSLFIFSSI